MATTININSILLLLVGLGATLVFTQGLSCEDPDWLSCESQDECYSITQKCDGHYDCKDQTDERQCGTVTQDGRVTYKTLSRGQNLAWLVPPILLLLGLAYGIYKCVKDGVCVAIKRRVLHGRRNRENRASDYHPLHQVSFYTSTQIPCTQLGINSTNLTPQQQMMLVHNQSFSIQIQGRGDGPASQTEAGLLPEGVTLPPTYEEAMSAMSDGKGGAIIMMKDGRVIAVPQGGVLPPPYTAQTLPRTVTRPGTAAPSGPQMEAIEEVEEVEEEELNDDNDADEETFFLPKDTRGDGNVGGRRRHHSQWSNKRHSENRRRHHSCPS